MQSWKTIKRDTILNFNKFLSIEAHTVELPNGRIIDNWPWIVTPDFVNVVAVDENGRFLIFRQTKYAIDGASFAPIGGYLEPGEEPLQAAQRELLEETGYTANNWHYLGSYAVDGNRGVGKAHFFLAQNAQPTTEINADDLEEQELLFLTHEEVSAALTSGYFKVLPWAAIIALVSIRR